MRPIENKWINLKDNKPPVNVLVELRHLITGIGENERVGWVSTGRMRENGRFSIKQNKEKTVDFRHPTHWKLIIE